MSDLNHLADATRAVEARRQVIHSHARPAPRSAVPVPAGAVPSRPPPSGDTFVKWRSVIIAIVALAPIAVIALVTTWFTAFEVGRSAERKVIADKMEQQWTAGEAIINSRLSSAEDTVDPKFSFGRISYDGESAGWEFVNEDTTPLVVNSMTVNGEYSLIVGHRVPGMVLPEPARRLPITLQIGESLVLFEYNISARTGSYSKQVIFADLDTNRGKFRWRDGHLKRR